MANYLARLARQWGGAETGGGDAIPSALLAPRLPSRFEPMHEESPVASLDQDASERERADDVIETEEQVKVAPTSVRAARLTVSALPPTLPAPARFEPMPPPAPLAAETVVPQREELGQAEVALRPPTETRAAREASAPDATPIEQERTVAPVVSALLKTGTMRAPEATGAVPTAARTEIAEVIPSRTEARQKTVTPTPAAEIREERRTETAALLPTERRMETLVPLPAATPREMRAMTPPQPETASEATTRRETTVIMTPVTPPEREKSVDGPTERRETAPPERRDTETPPAPALRPILAPLVAVRDDEKKSEGAAGRHESFAPPPAPTVQITIGRIEVRATGGAKAPTPPRARSESSVMTLEAYLQRQAARRAAR